jgi:hypothetical protein
MGMRVGWLSDESDALGGAELTQAEFRAAAPDDVEVVDCLPGAVVEDCDRYVIQNCVTYTLEDLEATNGHPVVKYHHDVGPHIQPSVKEWISRHAVQVCCSPVQADYMGIAAQLIPPPVDLGRFEAAAVSANGRKGAVCIGSWRNYGKAPHRAAEWAAGNGGIDFYGGGPFAPAGSVEVSYEEMPELLARYRTFVFLPTVIEPFGRTVAEAWAAGCEVVTNRLVGAQYWLEDDRATGIETAAADFWALVTK